MFLNYIWA